MDTLEIVSKMTDEEKTRILVGKDGWQTKDYIDLGISSVKTSDGPHGLRVEKPSKKIGLKESLNATSFPSPAAIASTWNVHLTKEVGELIGEEAAYQGVHVVLTPGVNIKKNPLCGRNFEYFSEDPYLAGKLGGAMISGVQKNGTGACLKHFAANNQEHRRMTVNSVVDERALREIYLTPFEIAVKDGSPQMVMTSYNRVNYKYAHENEELLSILRNDWNYDGVVTSDWGGENDIVNSVNAGGDLCMPASEYYVQKLTEGINTGKVDREKLDKAVGRIIKLQKNLVKSGKAGESGVEYDYNLQVARKCAEESIVLLNNDGVLPLNHFDPVTFFGDQVFDTVTQGGGSSRVNPLKKENLIDIIDQYDLNVAGAHATDFLTVKNKKSKSAPRNYCDDEIAVVVLGYPDYFETEGRDRPSLSLPDKQISAYRSIRILFKKVVVVVISGGIVDFSPFKDANATLYCPLGGEKSPTAIMRVLSGSVNPSGKLTETIPSSYDDVPANDEFGKDFTTLYKESVFVGYRYYEKAKVPVLYPFGHGLSYTEFQYSSASVSDKGVKFTVKNVGDYDGAEVCQVYVGKPESQIFRPQKELKGFTKVFLRAGEEKTLFIPFDEYTFRYFSEDTEKFEKEAGNYKIYVAASAEDIRLSVSLLNTGTAKIRQRSDIPTYFSGKINDVSKEEFQALLGKDVVEETYDFYMKNRIKIGLNSTLLDLAYSKGLITRIVGKVLRRKVKNINELAPKKAGDLLMTVNVPLRMAIVFAGLNQRQADGLLKICNGRFFKGLSELLKGKKDK